MIKIPNSIDRDERTITVENKSYSIGYKLALYALLLDTMYRSFFLHQPSWDLLGIILLCGIVTSLYQLNHKILTPNWIKASVIALILAIIVAVFFTGFSKAFFA